MQKARRHSIKKLRPIEAHGFRYFFTPLFGVLFTFPSRYWFTIGLSGVFSLTGWSRQIHTGFRVSRATQDTAFIIILACTGLSPSVMQLSRCFHFVLIISDGSPTTPKLPKQLWFGLVPVRSPLLRESLLFSLPPLT